MVAPFTHRHRDLSTTAANDNGVLDRRCFFERLVGDLLELNDASTAESAVGGDEQACVCIVDAIPQRLGRKAAEDDRVHRTNTSARQHRDGQLRNHRQVNGDAVAAFRAQAT